MHFQDALFFKSLNFVSHVINNIYCADVLIICLIKWEVYSYDDYAVGGVCFIPLFEKKKYMMMFFNEIKIAYLIPRHEAYTYYEHS